MNPAGRRGRPRPFQIVWSRRAEEDPRAIGEYIAADRPVAASRWIERILAAVEAAATFPMAARRVPERERDDLRESLRGNYRIVFQVRPREIVVLTVFEGHRRFPEDVGRSDETHPGG